MSVCPIIGDSTFDHLNKTVSNKSFHYICPISTLSFKSVSDFRTMGISCSPITFYPIVLVSIDELLLNPEFWRSSSVMMIF